MRTHSSDDRNSTPEYVEQELRISVGSGVGIGTTELAAFDSALGQIGIADFNLIPLSSIVPPGATVALGHVGEATHGARAGDRLYVVLSEARTSVRGSEVWAGLGWAQSRESGQGVFVEHSGTSRREVELLVEQSLSSMAATRPAVTFGDPMLHIVGGTCEALPICAAVVAVYGYESWSRGRIPDQSPGATS